MPDRAGGIDHHRDVLGQVVEVVGDLPEHRLEGDEGAHRDHVVEGQIGADRQHDQVQPEHHDGDRALDHGVEEGRARLRRPQHAVALAEPELRDAHEAEGLHHRLGADILLDDAELAGLRPLDLVAGRDRLRREQPRPDQGDRDDQQRQQAELGVEVDQEGDARQQLEQRQRAPIGEMDDRLFIGGHVVREARQDLAAAMALIEAQRQLLDVLEQRAAHIGCDRRRHLRVDPFIPDRHDRGDDPGDPQHAENEDQLAAVLVLEHLVEEVFERERHQHVEGHLDQQAEADQGDAEPMRAQMRPGEGEDAP